MYSVHVCRETCRIVFFCLAAAFVLFAGPAFGEQPAAGEEQVLFSVLSGRMAELAAAGAGREKLGAAVAADPLCSDILALLADEQNARITDADSCRPAVLFCVENGVCTYTCFRLDGGIANLSRDSSTCPQFLLCRGLMDCSANCYP
ncbi:hypothetical protein ACFL43_02400 [Thermodesulfobacteriota bacterium]